MKWDARFPDMLAGCGYRDFDLGRRNGRQLQMRPPTLLKQKSRQVILVEALHDHDDSAFGLVVEARQ